MQAIITKFHGPTAARGARVSAACAAKRITVDYDHGLDVHANHEAAAAILTGRLGWTEGNGYTRTASGTLPSGDHCHVFIPRA